MSFHAITIPPSLDPECELNQRLGTLGGGPGAGALLCMMSFIFQGTSPVQASQAFQVLDLKANAIPPSRTPGWP